MSDEAAIATLETKLENLTYSISALTSSVERNNEKLERLAVLEVAHNNSDKAIERAFAAITKVEKLVEDSVKANTVEHQTYNKWIWVVTGFCIAISIMWTVVGYRMNALIDDQIKAVVEMRTHIRDDKIVSPSDVLKAVHP